MIRPAALFLCLTCLLPHCARYSADTGFLGLALLGLRGRSANPVGKIYSGLTPMASASQSISLGGTVEMTRSIVLCYFRTSSSDPSSAPTCTLADSATIQVTTGASAAAYQVQWYVVEFTSGTVVQRGLEVFAPAVLTRDVSITAVDLSRSFTIVTARIPDNNLRTTDQQRFVRSRLTSDSNLRLARNAASPATCGTGPVACNVTAAWQVVQLADASVQSGEFSMTTASASQTITPVNLSKSFVMFSHSPNAAAGGIEGDYMIAPSLADETTLSFFRNSSTSTIDVSWHVIQMLDETFVQHGTTTDTTYPAAPKDITLGTEINQNASITTLSTTVASAANADVDVAYYTPTFTGSTNLRLVRGTGDGAGPSVTARWSAVQFVAQ
jgi:hypothetical protein